MSQGWFLVHRGWFESKMFHQTEFCERAAWIWMIEHACWQPTDIRVSGKRISLQRGQFSYSLRYMAKAWGWDMSRVRRFLNRLKSDTAIDTAIDTGRFLVTLLKYNDYQNDINSEVKQDLKQETKQHRNSTETNKKEYKQLKEVKINIPDWLPLDIWQSFVDHRKTLRPALTQRAAELALADLSKFHAAGQDPIVVINRSIMNGWKGLFPEKTLNGKQVLSDSKKEENQFEIWRLKIRRWKENGSWNPYDGPLPNEVNCKCPHEILKEMEIHNA